MLNATLFQVSTGVERSEDPYTQTQVWASNKKQFVNIWAGEQKKERIITKFSLSFWFYLEVATRVKKEK